MNAIFLVAELGFCEWRYPVISVWHALRFAEVDDSRLQQFLPYSAPLTAHGHGLAQHGGVVDARPFPLIADLRWSRVLGLPFLPTRCRAPALALALVAPAPRLGDGLSKLLSATDANSVPWLRNALHS